MQSQFDAGFGTFDDASNLANQSRFAMDSKLYVQFYVRPVMHAYKSSEAGRPIYEEKEYIKIIVPGDSKTTVDCPVDNTFRQRFEKQYDKFKKGLEQAVTGTPLEVWPQMSVGMVTELKSVGVQTVEQLAELSDANIQRFMGGNMWRQKAQAFLDAAAGDSANSKLAMELEKRDSEIAALKAQMDQILKAQATAPKATAKA
jgi:hypothetical protein